MATILAADDAAPQAPTACPGHRELRPKLQLRVLPARGLGNELTQAWLSILEANRTLESPFFRPEYTQVVAEVRNDVFVGVACEQDQPVAFFPFQRGAFMAGSPVGGPLTDYQGVVCRPEIVVEPIEWLRACSLASWRFDHLLPTQQAFAPYRLLEDHSPGIDLSCGLDEYLNQRRQSSNSEFSHTERKVRKVQRELGPLRLEWNDRNPALLETLLQWKTPQYELTRAPNIFAYEWILQVLRRLQQLNGPGLVARFTTLYANDELLAINLGLCTGEVYHVWMTTYNHAYARYSPGKILLLEQIKAAAQGIRLIDMGRGREPYKKLFANTATPIWEGAVERMPITRGFRKTWIRAREWVQTSRHRETIRRAWSWVRPVRDWMKYR